MPISYTLTPIDKALASYLEDPADPTVLKMTEALGSYCEYLKGKGLVKENFDCKGPSPDG